jgi:hypothetical protein
MRLATTARVCVLACVLALSAGGAWADSTGRSTSRIDSATGDSERQRSAGVVTTSQALATANSTPVNTTAAICQAGRCGDSLQALCSNQRHASATSMV